MNYIINPSWFYWISVVDSIRTLSAVAFTLSFSGVFLLSICVVFCRSTINEFPSISKGERKRLPLYEKLLKACIIASPVFVALLIFIPSRNTLIEMQIAKYATYENAEWTLDAIKSVVDYIVNAIQSMK